MPITRKEVEEIALLARLALSEPEMETMTRQLGEILGYVDKLRQLDTEGIEGTTHAVPLDCPLREDVVAGQIPAEAALAAAPRHVDSWFEVPRIIEVRGDES